jgi:molybdenum cofactor guanylyltransferase
MIMKSAAGEVCILAGGLSTRMGRDKSRMRLGGKTLLEHVQKIASAAGWPVRVIRRDMVPRCGPLGGVYTALQTSEAESLLFLACDMPFVSGAWIENLVQHVDPKAEAVFTQERDRVGFPFLLRRSVLSQIQRQFVLGEFSLEQLARACGAARVTSPPGQSWMFLNINRPKDWQVARQLARHEGKTSKSKIQTAEKLEPTPQGRAVAHREGEAPAESQITSRRSP